MDQKQEKNMHSNDAQLGRTDVERFLCFSLNEEYFAIPLLSVREVIGMPDITPVPHTPAHFLGIMNLRGQVISIIDLRAKLSFKADKTTETCVIICDLGAICVGVVVSAVNNVLPVKYSELTQKPDMQGQKAQDFVTSVVNRDKKLILLLDIARALGVEDKAAIQRLAEKKAA